MDAHGWKMKGDFETDNIRSQDGVLSIEIENTTGKTTLKNDLVIEAGSPASGKVLTSTDALGNVEFDYQSIPANSIILFESDTAVTGYTLLTNVNDQLIYITRGSAAGGETGGTTKSGSTWTQPSHTHTLGSHTHTTGSHALTTSEIPSHSHGQYRWQWKDGTGSNPNHYYAQGIWDDGYGTWYSSGVGSTGGGSSHNHGSTGAASGATGSGSTTNSWRPSGRNFTRQRKN